MLSKVKPESRMSYFDSPVPSPSTGAPSDVVFCLRNVQCDYAMVSPIPQFDENNASNFVPVIRIFGCTPMGLFCFTWFVTFFSGQKCCLHVHGVYPYILVECIANQAPNNEQMKKIGESIEFAINMARQQQKLSNNVQQDAFLKNIRHVHSVTLRRLVYV